MQNVSRVSLDNYLLILYWCAGKQGKLGRCGGNRRRREWAGRGSACGAKTGAAARSDDRTLEVLCGCRAHYCPFPASIQPLLLGVLLI